LEEHPASSCKGNRKGYRFFQCGFRLINGRLVVWPVTDEVQLLALDALGLKAPVIRERLGNRYSIHQVRYQLREHRRSCPEGTRRCRLKSHSQNSTFLRH
jgi:hypothetical protein